MLNINKLIIFSLLCFFYIQDNYADDANENKNILVLHAMVPSTPAYRIITDGIRSKLTEVFGDQYNLHLDYLESERFPKGAYPKERFELFNEKYEDLDLDLLIYIGVDIVDPVKKNASEKLLNLPAIVIDFDLTEYGIKLDLTLNDKTVVIGVRIDVSGTLNSAVSLFPERTAVYFVMGTSKADLLYGEATLAAAKHFDQRIASHFLTGMSMDQLLDTVRHLPDNGIIIIPSLNVDSKGVPYYNPESVRLISQAANVPVFAYSDMGFGDGSVGGHILSFKKIGIIAGETAIKILNGADPASIKIDSREIFEHMYDWRQLKRWELAGSELIPKGSRIMFEEISFFRKFRIIIIATVIFLIIQSLLIINLVRLNRKQRQVTAQLLEAENKYRALVREDRILRIGQLTASLSHELNQPLTAILSTAQAGINFIDSSTLDPVLLKELFQNIVEDDKRTASILSSIRGMLKLEKREKEKVNLNILVEEIINIYLGESIIRGIKLQMILPEQPVFILADPIQIQQVIMNLLLNAMQSIEKAQPKTRQVTIKEVADKELVTVSVRDHGEGIADSVKDKLFKPFVTSKKEGTGIGLSISRSIIEDHEGRIWAENVPDGGAIFSFSLKVYQNEPGSKQNVHH